MGPTDFKNTSVSRTPPCINYYQTKNISQIGDPPISYSY